MPPSQRARGSSPGGKKSIRQKAKQSGKGARGKSRRRAKQTRTGTRRLAPAVRVEQILMAAAVFFADHGFLASTRDLAKRIGITQALIYRYFPSKQALLRRLLEVSQNDDWLPLIEQAMADRSKSLTERITDMYVGFLGNSDGVGLRLWMRAALDGQAYPRRYADPLTDRVMVPVMEEVRVTLGLPSLAQRPLLRAERDLALSLHGSVMFVRIRQHVYRLPVAEPLREFVAGHVSTVLPAVLAGMAAAHAAREANHDTGAKTRAD